MSRRNDGEQRCRGQFKIVRVLSNGARCVSKRIVELRDALIVYRTIYDTYDSNRRGCLNKFLDTEENSIPCE